MPRCRRLQLEAVGSYAPGSENRLTEVLATTLEIHAAFAAGLFELAGFASEKLARYTVYTQETVAPGCRIDMRACAHRSGGAVAAQLWGEHKRHGGVFSTDQLGKYTRALASADGRGKLIAIVPAADELLDEGDRYADVQFFSWLEVAQLANRIGRAAEGEWGGLGWAENANRPNAPAKQYALCSFISLLEEDGYAVVDPLTPDDVDVFAKAPDTFNKLVMLLEDTARRVSMAADGPIRELDIWVFQNLAAPADSWVARLADELECSLQLAVVPDDEDWAVNRTRKPAFAIGVSFDKSLHNLLSGHDEGRWAQRLEAAGFGLAALDDDVCSYASLPMTDLTGDTLESQAVELARWAEAKLAILLALDPGPISRLRRPVRRAVRASAAKRGEA